MLYQVFLYSIYNIYPLVYLLYITCFLYTEQFCPPEIHIKIMVFRGGVFERY
jgi:hypothetical protein